MEVAIDRAEVVERLDVGYAGGGSLKEGQVSGRAGRSRTQAGTPGCYYLCSALAFARRSALPRACLLRCLSCTYKEIYVFTP